jgi:alpha-methylacyl-CoA racemase
MSNSAGKASGPLAGLRVVELAGIGPGPFATMMLAELGADVIRIERPGGNAFFPGIEHLDLLNRGKRSLGLDLKQAEAVEILLSIVEHSDILVEGYRPGVAERLGLGPDACLSRKPSLVYGRMTGWGQEGPLSNTAGHDINYIAITGALGAIGPADEPPQVPLNLVGDFGGGSLYLVAGVLAALYHARRTGEGQVIDASISDGASHLLTAVHAQMAAGMWTDRRASNMLDGGAPYYSVYDTSDARFMAVGAIEPQFFALLLSGLGLPAELQRSQNDHTRWPALRSMIAQAFRSHTQAHWVSVFEGTDACVTPVLSLREAAANPHQSARRTLVQESDVLQAQPAPRFSRTVTELPTTAPRPGADTKCVLEQFGYDASSLIDAGVAYE